MKTITLGDLPCIAQMIEIPLPPKHCTPNSYCHWRTRGRAAKQYRREAWAACIEQRREPMVGLVRVRLTVNAGPTQEFDKRYRPLDAQNLIASLKAAIDGIVDAGVLAGDSKQYLCWGEVIFFTRKRQHQGRACIELWLETCD